MRAVIPNNVRNESEFIGIDEEFHPTCVREQAIVNSYRLRTLTQQVINSDPSTNMIVGIAAFFDCRIKGVFILLSRIHRIKNFIHKV